MDGSQSNDKISGEKFRLLIFDAISRGIPIQNHTAGQVLWMLKQAMYRERVLLACSAQEPKLLPKSGMSKSDASKKIEQILPSAIFDDLVKEDAERRKKLKCQSEQSKQVKP